MHDHKPELAFRAVNLQHYVSLEKHQRVIDEALQWQRVSRLVEKESKSVATKRLRPILMAIFHLVTK
jgi:hypothetical protein